MKIQLKLFELKSIKIFIVLGVLLAFASTLLLAQNRKELNNKGKTIPINIDIVKVDSKFYTLIDSLLYHERKCSYYSDTLTYGIWIERNIANNGDSVIVISINVNSEKQFFINDYEEETPFGYCTYKRHTFFFFGRNDLLFFTTNKKKVLEIPEYFPEEDDRWTWYLFLYYRDKFILYEKISNLCR